MNNFGDKFVVFLDTSVILSAFVGYRQHRKLPTYMNDPDTLRFTFEKCVFEAYMAFRGVGGKKPSEGRGDWANRFLKNVNDPKSLDQLASQIHGNEMGYALFWINNILSVGPACFSEATSQYNRPEEPKKADQMLDDLTELKRQRFLYKILCDDFRQMLRECSITELLYMQVFNSERKWIEDLDVLPRAFPTVYALDTFVRETVIPSEDFENVYAASRIRADMFVTDDNHLIRCGLSLGLNEPLSPASFCRGDEYEAKKLELKAGLASAKLG